MQAQESEVAGKLARVMGRPVVLEPFPLVVTYPAAEVGRESLKGLAGAGMFLGVALTVRPAAVLLWPMVALGVLLGGYALHQLMRRNLRYEVDDQAIVRIRGADHREIRWAGLESLKLRFYPRRRGRPRGVLVLSLGGGPTFRIDSAAHHFAPVLCHAARVARQRNLRLGEVTRQNLQQLGL